MKTKADILEKMSKAREELGWSMETTARYLDVTENTYQRWQYGQAEPNFENTLKIQNFIEDYEKGNLEKLKENK
ncbi:helix-turn-helix transcriptional regulator [Candidatus Bipolaricaulota bacterium]|nr:helix-turn-helix transcriptional regulator [Candidatus Bipolaricaulota bacterium]